MSGREIYSALAVCGYFKIERKIYNDWVKTEKSLLGFEGSVNVKWDKDVILNKIKHWCEDRSLPVVIVNISGHPTRFKIKIIKPCTQE